VSPAGGPLPAGDDESLPSGVPIALSRVRCAVQVRLGFRRRRPLQGCQGEIMFAHNKRLQYTVRVSETNPGLANLLLEQFGGPQGELAAAMRYFTQAIAETDPGRKDMLMDIATEELSHLEVIGTIVS